MLPHPPVYLFVEPAYKEVLLGLLLRMLLVALLFETNQKKVGKWARKGRLPKRKVPGLVLEGYSGPERSKGDSHTLTNSTRCVPMSVSGGRKDSSRFLHF